jgi:hypothetical protein
MYLYSFANDAKERALMAREVKKLHNFRLDADASQLLELLAKSGNTTQSQAIRDMIYSSAKLWQAGQFQLREAFRTIAERLGADTSMILAVEANQLDEPIVHLIFGFQLHDMDEPRVPVSYTAGFRAVGNVVGDKVHVYLDFGDAVPEATYVGIGNETIRIPVAQLFLGTLDWPPNPRQALRLRIRDLIEPADPDHPVAALSATLENIGA